MPVASHTKYVGVSFLESIMYKDLYRIKDLFGGFQIQNLKKN